MRDSAAEILEKQLLTMAAQRGCRVSPEQLRRWRQADAMPRPFRRSLGRARGFESLYPAGALPQLLALNDLLRRHRSLDDATWKLWWLGFNIPLDRTRTLLEAEIDWLTNHRRALEHLEEMDSETLWKSFAGLENHLLKARTHRFLRKIRRRIGGADYVTFVLRILSVGAGNFDRFEADYDFSVFNRVFGFDQCSPGQAKASNDHKAAEGLEDTLRAISRLIGVNSLTCALDSATEDALLAARSELREFMSLIETIRMLLLGLLGTKNAILEMLVDTLSKLSLKDHLHLFLIWLSLRQSKSFRQNALTILAQLKSASSKPANDG